MCIVNNGIVEVKSESIENEGMEMEREREGRREREREGGRERVYILYIHTPFILRKKCYNIVYSS